MNTSEHLLTCLAEECSEVTKDICKALRFGLDNCDPNTFKTNRDKIFQEAVEIMAILELLQDYRILPNRQTREIAGIKKKKVLKFMEYARNESKTISD